VNQESPILLDVNSVTKVFGGLVAVDNLSFAVPSGEHIKSIIGPNGAGKTTVLNMIAGVLKPTSGRIEFEGMPTSGLETHEIARLGIARTFQNVMLFPNMTALENVMVGCHSRSVEGLLSAAFRMPSQKREERSIVERALAKLELVGLADNAAEAATSLPFGKQRLLEIARGLASEPKLLLLDEPASGLSAREVVSMAEVLAKIGNEGVTVVLVDHDMQFVMDISDEVVVMDQGRKIAEGPPMKVQNNPHVIAAYLGEED